MFKKKTVFILGAGASCHYGYPTGEGLVKKVIEKAAQLSKYFQYSRKAKNGQVPKYVTDKMTSDSSTDDAWKSALEESQRIETSLRQTDTLVIDYFSV